MGKTEPLTILDGYMSMVKLFEEYTYRYGKVHGSQSRILDIAYTIDEDSNWSFATPVTIAMDDKYRLVKDN